MHSSCFSTDTSETKMMIKFSTLKILKTFKKVNLSVDIRASRLQSVNDAYNDIVDAFDEIIDLSLRERHISHKIDLSIL